jgi:Raf kinase inhibitor-like YbhB/YbcL family protein
MSVSRSRPRVLPKKASTVVAFVALSIAGLAGCKQDSVDHRVPMSLTVESPSFRQGEDIPAQFTCSGSNLSPTISWGTLPANTKSLVLLVSDSDSFFGSYVHWVLYNLPREPNYIAEGVPRSESLPDGAKQGLNGDDAIGYSGPCPPGKSPHRYVFTLYALDTTLAPQAPVGKKQLVNAMEGHILAAGQLIGHYHR